MNIAYFRHLATSCTPPYVMTELLAHQREAVNIFVHLYKSTFNPPAFTRLNNHRSMIIRFFVAAQAVICNKLGMRLRHLWMAMTQWGA